MATPSCHRMLACSGGGQNLTVGIKYHKRLHANQTHQNRSDGIWAANPRSTATPSCHRIGGSCAAIPNPRSTDTPNPRSTATPSCIGLVEVEQQFAIPNPRSTVTPNPRSTATPSCHRIGGSWAAIPNPRFTATPNPRSTATPNPRSTATPNLRSTASLNPRSTASLNPSLRQLQIPGLRHV